MPGIMGNAAKALSQKRTGGMGQPMENPMAQSQEIGGNEDNMIIPVAQLPEGVKLGDSLNIVVKVKNVTPMGAEVSIVDISGGAGEVSEEPSDLESELTEELTRKEV